MNDWGGKEGLDLYTRESKTKGHVREDDGLVLRRSPHVVVCIVGELEDVGRKPDLVGGGVTVLGRVLVEDSVGITGNILVGIYCDNR